MTALRGKTQILIHNKVTFEREAVLERQAALTIVTNGCNARVLSSWTVCVLETPTIAGSTSAEVSELCQVFIILSFCVGEFVKAIARLMCKIQIQNVTSG